ncbi:helix-turn-helix domain-containing protein [Megamonas funiformis]|uniref:helix-turn-helix domain-containing protein n=1 Tax=Megamonas funiformis TaxID=437897 RepID=UPI0022E9285B|nr:helix-turn-helix transcriptional regulator [Megamonas funiformis]
MDFKDRLRYYREQRGYSSDELAKLLDIPYTTLKGYENAGREPKYNILVKIADILNVSLDDLLGRTPTSEDEKIKELFALKNGDKNGDIDILSINLNNIKKDCILFDIYLYDNKNISADKKRGLIKENKNRKLVNKSIMSIDKVEFIKLLKDLREQAMSEYFHNVKIFLHDFYHNAYIIKLNPNNIENLLKPGILTNEDIEKQKLFKIKIISQEDK